MLSYRDKSMLLVLTDYFLQREPQESFSSSVVYVADILTVYRFYDKCYLQVLQL